MSAAGLGVWFATFTASVAVLARDPESAALRGAMVLLGLAGFITWLWVSVLAIRSQDEFTRHTHLVALAAAFALTAVFVMAADFLARAHFIDFVPLSWIWMWMVAAWVLSLFLTPRLYR